MALEAFVEFLRSQPRFAVAVFAEMPDDQTHVVRRLDGGMWVPEPKATRVKFPHNRTGALKHRCGWQRNGGMLGDGLHAATLTTN
jgi:hypothetical protein